MNPRPVLAKCLPAGVRSFIKNVLGISSTDTSVDERLSALRTSLAAAGHRADADAMALRGRIERIEAALDASGALPRRVETARGYFEKLACEKNLFRASGWMLLPDRELDTASLYINRVKVAQEELAERGSLQDAFPFISHSRRSAFDFSVPLPQQDGGGFTEIRVTGSSRGNEAAQMVAWYYPGLYSCYPLPPAENIKRSQGSIWGDMFMISGLQSYMEFWNLASSHLDARGIRTMLEWGCGCGRITRFFLSFSGIPSIHGCDIDSDSIAWCRDFLPPGIFSTVDPYPPTGYADDSFDLIIAYSVLTHLAKEVQHAWLEELRRILAPGGLLLATVHGEFAAGFALPGRQAEELLAGGIYDGMVDHGLDGVAPSGYYRGVFQKQGYTREAYSRYFEIIDYRERGALNFQDMVVMRKRRSE
ncbi:MAG: class I SAM-dependent methyltransferase [Candidatus Aureabacteria bacterium]|nr:class I SAM-dependent methyltransferase [Candidatus Auribacterota bacterium]NLW93971.1 class I SAM-dependent methyltransferase [Chlamydiota bacterium]HOE27449.1 class I SAM-dependent methyltransferase [bacterium]HQM52708.1 class I SAM-dependent methyltransferase [bacterium]